MQRISGVRCVERIEEFGRFVFSMAGITGNECVLGFMHFPRQRNHRFDQHAEHQQAEQQKLEGGPQAGTVHGRYGSGAGR